MILAIAWSESKATLRKEAWRLALAGAVTIGAAYFAPGLVDVGRLLLASIVPAVAILGFLWKFVRIPARLHRWQKDADEIRRQAEILERLHTLGMEIHAEGLRAPDFATWWLGEASGWTDGVESALQGYRGATRSCLEQSLLILPACLRREFGSAMQLRTTVGNTLTS